MRRSKIFAEKKRSDLVTRRRRWWRIIDAVSLKTATQLGVHALDVPANFVRDLDIDTRDAFAGKGYQGRLYIMTLAEIQQEPIPVLVS